MLGFRLLLLVLIAAVPVTALEIFDRQSERDEQRAALSAAALNTADLVAERLNQFVETARSLTIAAAQLSEVRERNAAGCSARLHDIIAQFPIFRGMAAFDATGVSFCRSSGEPGAVSIGDRPFFQQVLLEKTFVASGYIVGRLVNRPTMAFLAPALDPSGQVQAIIVLVVEFDSLSKSLADIPLPLDAVVGIVDPTGVLLARVPAAPELIGRQFPNIPPTDGLQALRRGTVIATGVDGIERIFAFSALTMPTELYALYGIPLAASLAPIDARFWRSLALLGVIFLAAVAAALVGGRLFIQRPISTLQALANQWARGNLLAHADMGPGTIGEVRDLTTSLHSMASALEAGEKRRSLLLEEVQHRIRNTLATVQAVVRQTVHGRPEDAEVLVGRLSVLARTHDLLATKAWERADLRALVETVLAIHTLGEAANITITGPDISLPPRLAQVLGMAVHELATNAAKYGALSVANGRLLVDWERGGDRSRSLIFRWTERDGPPVLPPRRKGFGSILLEEITAREFDAQVNLDFRPAGLVAVLTIPMVGEAEPDQRATVDDNSRESADVRTAGKTGLARIGDRS